MSGTPFLLIAPAWPGIVGQSAKFAIVVLSNASFTEGDAQGTDIGTLSVAGGSGTYTFSLTDASNQTQLNVDGVTLEVGSVAASAGTFQITITASNGTDPDLVFAVTINVIAAGGATTGQPMGLLLTLTYAS